jgi:hypothetical protein
MYASPTRAPSSFSFSHVVVRPSNRGEPLETLMNIWVWSRPVLLDSPTNKHVWPRRVLLYSACHHMADRGPVMSRVSSAVPLAFTRNRIRVYTTGDMRRMATAQSRNDEAARQGKLVVMRRRAISQKCLPVRGKKMLLKISLQ